MTASRDGTVAAGTLPTATQTQAGEAAPVRVWDPLVRIFHWSLVTAFAVSWLTGDDMRQVHMLSGYVIAGLLGFRLLWGLVGPMRARFTDFVHHPVTVFAYLRDVIGFRARRYVGHNPAGGAMVVALLSVLIVSVVTGLMMTSDTFWGVEWVEEVHGIAANVALLLVGLHLAGVFAASLQHRENLVLAMITGRKRA